MTSAVSEMQIGSQLVKIKTDLILVKNLVF